MTAFKPEHLVGIRWLRPSQGSQQDVAGRILIPTVYRLKRRHKSADLL